MRILAVLLVFCSGSMSAEIFTLRVKSDTTLSVAVYSPNTISDLKTKPAIFFFDPGGSGEYPIDLYESLAKKYDFVLIGANFSRNGLAFEKIAADFNIVLNELINVYGLNTKMLCLSGFSGGGKTALFISGMQPSIPYVIYGGATIDSYLSGKNVLGFAGTKDMNYTDLLDYDNSLNIKVNVSHFIVEYDGYHSWFDSATMENSFVWMKLTLMKNKMLPADNSFIQVFSYQFQKETDSLEKTQQWLKADNINRKAISFLKDLADVKPLEVHLLSLEKSSSFKKEKKKNDDILQKEKSSKDSYDKYFIAQDTTWWKEEISKLKSDENSESNIRLLWYIVQNCYYSINDAFEANNLDAAKKLLDIYKITRPQSAEQAFLRAVYYAMKNDQQKSDAAFSEAKQLGFNEWDHDSGETILQYFKRRHLK